MEFTTDRGLLITVLETMKTKELEKLSREFEAVLFSREDEICETCTDCKGIVCEVEDCQKIKVERNVENHYVWDMKEVLDEIINKRNIKESELEKKRLAREEKKKEEALKQKLLEDYYRKIQLETGEPSTPCNPNRPHGNILVVED